MPFEQPNAQGSAFTDGVDQWSHDLATSIRETFHTYGIRDSPDNRSSQRHLGPSEIGSSCDRRIAMSLMGIPATNPGGDGFAAWLGTQGHAGMADIYEWANGQSGRYAVETKLSFPSKLVPRGTGDLLDRKLRVFVDWKFMGTWSLKKLRDTGPSAVYRTQIHTYAYGAVTRGEKVDRVAIVGMPRQGSSLDEMFVWSEPYDKAIAVNALQRVEDIGKRVAEWEQDGGTNHERAQLIASFPIHPDSGCKYCPHYLPKSTDLGHACNGKA